MTVGVVRQSLFFGLTLFSLCVFALVLLPVPLDATEESVYAAVEIVPPQPLAPSVADSILRPIWAGQAKQPPYPQEGRDAEIRTTVWLRIMVGELGIVQRAEAVHCEHPGYGFEEMAVAVAKDMLFRPAWDGPFPVEYTGYFPLVFKDPYTRAAPIQMWSPFSRPEGVGVDAPLINPEHVAPVQYPAKAARRLLEGDVTLKLRISKKGTVLNSQVFAVDKEQVGFEDAAAKRSRASEFPVFTRKGRATDYACYARFSFRLSDSILQGAGLPLPEQPPNWDIPPRIKQRQVRPSGLDSWRSAFPSTVRITALIDRTGALITARLDSSSGEPRLDTLVLRNATSHDFAPAKRNDSAIASWCNYVVMYDPPGMWRFQTPFDEELAPVRQTKLSLADTTQLTSASLPGDTLLYDDIEIPDVLPHLVKYEKAMYPKVALDRGLVGTAKVAALIGADSTLLECRVVRSSGHSVLDSLALKAAGGHRFTPGLIEGKPVKSWTSWRVEFKPGSKSVMPEGGETHKVVYAHAQHIEEPNLPNGFVAEGTVWIEAVLDTSGAVESADIFESSGNETLDQSALAAATKHRFFPSTVNGKPARSTYRYRVVYTIEGPKTYPEEANQ